MNNITSSVVEAIKAAAELAKVKYQQSRDKYHADMLAQQQRQQMEDANAWGLPVLETIHNVLENNPTLKAAIPNLGELMYKGVPFKILQNGCVVYGITLRRFIPDASYYGDFLQDLQNALNNYAAFNGCPPLVVTRLQAHGNGMCQLYVHF